MSIHELTALVPPPAQPVSPGSAAAWEQIQEQLGTRLPDDLRELGMAYGSGAFQDVGRHEVLVYNPFSPAFHDSVWWQVHNLAAMKAGEGDDYVPFDVFPSSPGLLALGSDMNGNELYWLTEGRPNDWPIVTRSRESEYQQFEGPLTRFLARAFRRQIAVGMWPAPYFTEPGNIRFKPEAPAPQQDVTPTNVYELYVDNGNQAGFWVREIYAQPGIVTLVKAVNGKRQGPLPGIPVEYGRAPVEADLYENGTLYRAGADLPHAYQWIWVRVRAPGL